MAVPLLMKRRTMAAKIETTVGTDVTPSGTTDGTLIVFDPTMSPDTEYEDRPRADRFSHRKGTLGPSLGTFKFKTELMASVTGAEGAATNPTWATLLLPACGYVATGNVFSPVTGAPGGSGGVKTLTMSLYEDGWLKKLVGAMGNLQITADAGKKIWLDWTFRGVWVAPVTASVPAPSYVTCVPAIMRSTSLVLGSFTPVVSKLTLDLGNKVEMRQDATTSSGYISAIITDRMVKGQIDPEADTSRDTYAIWTALTTAAMSWSNVTGTRTVSFSAPYMQITKLAETDRNGIHADTYDFQCNTNTDAGDDEFTITFS